MKNLLLFLFTAGFALTLTAQYKPVLDQKMNQRKDVYQKFNYDGNQPGVANPNPIVTNKAILEDAIITTIYDMQSNGNSPRHNYYYPDGTIGATSVRGVDEATTWGDRGTGYNYFNGTAWGTPPTARIESVRTGWPNYQPFGAGGEVVLSHQSATTNLVLSTRTTKGTGSWTDVEIPTVAGASGMLWPRVITSGPDHTNIHIIALTSPTANGGTTWNGMDGALLYTRSLDGGTTWDAWQQLDGMGTADYTSFTADIYEWANPIGDTLAFVFADSWLDMVIMKSTDNGTTWTKNTVWDCPGVDWNQVDTIEFYATDGLITANMDSKGKVHILTGLQYSIGYEGGMYFLPAMHGLIYWNEDMDVLPEYFDSTYLADNGNFIAWCPYPSLIALVDPFPGLAYYYNSLTSFPAMVIDQDDNVYAFWAGLTENTDAESFYLRHIYARGYNNAAGEWSDAVDLNESIIWYGTENIFPTVSPTCSADKLQLSFQSDDLAGIYLRTTPAGHIQTSPTTNTIYFMDILKSDILPTVGVKEPIATPAFYVFQNTPNPVQNATTVKVNLAKNANLSLDVTSIVGQKLIAVNKGNVNAGSYQFTLDCSNFPSGVYFYTVTVGNESVTRKMIVE